ncbi:MAG TPA: hypothetical protein VK013_05860 [Myxococcaceae bacterium]|nr:hypothetical protein [Myxococcaceae bacterium]
MSDPIVRRRVTLPKNRQSVTREPDPGGRWTPLFPGMIGYNSQGGGKVPPLWWTSSPKARQEEMTDETLATRWLSPDYPLARALAESKGQTALPTGQLHATLPHGEGETAPKAVGEGEGKKD